MDFLWYFYWKARRWLTVRSNVQTVTIYLKSGNTISFDVTSYEWKYRGNELESYNFKFAAHEKEPMRYVRIDQIEAITVSQY